MSEYFKIAAFFSAILVLLLNGVNYSCQAQNYTVTVTAGAFDRSGTVVSFHFPEDVPLGVYRMESENGKSVQLQVDGRNRGWFILDELEVGSSRSFDLTAGPLSSPVSGDGVASTIDRNTISFQADGDAVLSYFHGENDLPDGLDEQYQRGGYIHPVYSPEGTILTNHLDTEIHPHHYGIWSAWTSTRFQGHSPDFWNVHDNTGRIDHANSLDTAWEGPVHGGLRAKNYFVDLSAPAPVIALNEEWKVTVYDKKAGNRAYHIFDLEVIHTANTAQPLELPEYHYGGVAFRGHGNWNDPDNVSFLTSEGYDRNNGNETRARWACMFGLVDKQQAGIAVLGHPGNPRAPQPVRIHPGIPYFVYTPQQMGDMAIEAGSPYISRYRYVTFDGKPDPAELNRLWNDYAYPPGVTVVAK